MTVHGGFRGFKTGKNFYNVLLLFLIIYVAFTVEVRGQSYLWPTNASRYMSSSFCEYRSGHFHAGIDIKTQGRTGFETFAVRPGYIWRVRVSPSGYGRSLYLRLDTGETAVYAHLSHYIPEIEARIRSEQLRRGRFSVDLFFGPGEFPVERGDTIAYTGRTGTSAPHLHFEIRDRNNSPVNPLFFGLQIADTRSPTITALSITPLDAFSKVNGDVKPLILRARAADKATYIIADTTKVYGRIGLGISCYDRADGASNKYAPYSLTLFVDDALVYKSAYLHFDYAITGQIDLEYDYRLARRGFGNYHNLYKTVGSRLPFYEYLSPTGGVLWCGVSDAPENDFTAAASVVEMLTPGIHEIRVEVVDYFDNLSVVKGYIYRQSVSSAALASSSPPMAHSEMGYAISPLREASPSATLRSDFYDEYVRFIVECEKIYESAPMLSVSGGDDYFEDLVVRELSPDTFVGVLPLSAKLPSVFSVEAYFQGERKSCDSLDFRVFPVDNRNGGRIISDDGLCRISFAPGALYRPLFGRISTVFDSLSTTPEKIGNSYRVEPTDVPFAKSARIELTYPPEVANQQQLGIYGRSTNGWYFVGNAQKAGAPILSASIGGFGEYAVVRDSLPPTITRLRPAHGDSIANGQPTLRVYFKDDLSGVAGESGVIMRLDGEEVICEYDPIRNTAFFVPYSPISRGGHTVEVEITDNAGNSKKVEHKFYIK